MGTAHASTAGLVTGQIMPGRGLPGGVPGSAPTRGWEHRHTTGRTD